MGLRSAKIHYELFLLLESASFVAELAVPASQRKDVFAGQGNIYGVPDEVMFFAQAARLPGVRLIGEVGFNAGHSAISFLSQSEHSKLISFDLEEVKWASQSLDFVHRLFPDRVDRLKGGSETTVANFAKEDPRKFDLFAIDGNHFGQGPYLDMIHGRKASRPGAYVIIDDWTPSFPDVRQGWERAKKEKLLEEIVCVHDPSIRVYGYLKGVR